MKRLHFEKRNFGGKFRTSKGEEGLWGVLYFSFNLSKGRRPNRHDDAGQLFEDASVEAIIN